MTNPSMSRLSLTSEEITSWITTQIAQITNLDEDEINPNDPFTNFGIDSMHVITFVGDLEDWLGIPIQATLLWDYPTIHAVTEHLSQRLLATNE
ncbi:phosphopantetheine attachment site domain protein [Paenibacillus sp. CCS19]|uniref:acyl carrier protein n=1 Tax=Paenibacillus sp. CCS19 TaxID=3158387 RepID=UPI0025616CD0|nr:acyl carrier protein [Paenibacillus cellulosilyticus]GMK39955.1 phosphopantetheine attachment site domain protein [Paenibacillus cellulosilyticus]